MPEKIRMGMVGGGPGAFIGAVHRMAAAVTGEIDLVAGAFSRDAEASRKFGAELGLNPDRAYGSYADMMKAEAALPESERMQFVAIVTPNETHSPVGRAALDAGFHVLCDKPIAGTLEDGMELYEAATKSDRLFGLTHTYTGYPLVKEARARVDAGEIGKVRRVKVCYLQDWLSLEEDAGGSKQAAWRTDPKRSGESGAFGDIGTHAFNLVEFMTGERMTEVAADLRAAIPGREIDDDGGLLFRLASGAPGTLEASQVCTGAINGLKIEVYGEKASLFWEQEQPNALTIKYRGAPEQVLRAGANIPYLSQIALDHSRTPGGHPEGYIEAFANIYADFVKGVRAFPKKVEGPLGYASADDGIAAMRFIRAARVSTKNKSAWTALDGIERVSIG